MIAYMALFFILTIIVPKY